MKLLGGEQKEIILVGARSVFFLSMTVLTYDLLCVCIYRVWSPVMGGLYQYECPHNAFLIVVYHRAFYHSPMNRQAERTISKKPLGNIQPPDGLCSVQNIALGPKKGETSFNLSTWKVYLYKFKKKDLFIMGSNLPRYIHKFYNYIRM